MEGFTFEKLDELIHGCFKKAISRVFLQETWLTKDNSTDNDISIPEYNIFRKDRLNGAHGGVLAYCRQDICATEIMDNVIFVKFEVLWLQIKYGDHLQCLSTPT